MQLPGAHQPKVTAKKRLEESGLMDKLTNIKLLAMDIDGTLTDGGYNLL